jgi:hypothetical protein
VKRPSPTSRRLLSLAATLTIGVLAALAIASPASAWTGSISGSAECQSGTWVVTWTISNDFNAPATIKSFQATPDTPVKNGDTTIGVGTPIAALSKITGTQEVPGDATAAKLVVEFEWTARDKFTATGKVTLEGTCVKPSPSPSPSPVASPSLSPVPSAVVSASPSTGGGGGGGGLPTTGVSGIAFGGVALVLIGGGTALVLLGRRRRGSTAE